MAKESQKPSSGWIPKFLDAFRGVLQGIRGQNSFIVHFSCAAVVLLLATLLRMSVMEWSVLVACIFAVFVAEMFNSALETLAKAIDVQYNPHLEKGLNIAAAAVLLASLGAVIIGSLIFGSRLVTFL